MLGTCPKEYRNVSQLLSLLSLLLLLVVLSPQIPSPGSRVGPCREWGMEKALWSPVSAASPGQEEKVAGAARQDSGAEGTECYCLGVSSLQTVECCKKVSCCCHCGGDTQVL